MDFIANHEQRDLVRRLVRLPMFGKLHLVTSVLRDSRVTPLMEAPLLAAVAYIVLPINLVPRRLFFVRTFDDVIVAGLGLWLFVRLVPPEVLDEHLKKIESHPED